MDCLYLAVSQPQVLCSSFAIVSCPLKDPLEGRCRLTCDAPLIHTYIYINIYQNPLMVWCALYLHFSDGSFGLTYMALDDKISHPLQLKCYNHVKFKCLNFLVVLLVLVFRLIKFNLKKGSANKKHFAYCREQSSNESKQVCVWSVLWLPWIGTVLGAVLWKRCQCNVHFKGCRLKISTQHLAMGQFIVKIYWTHWKNKWKQQLQ